jgi:hypothetical protein
MLVSIILPSVSTGATIAELMHRGGHSSPAVAIRHQHATENRDRALAEAPSAFVAAKPPALENSPPRRSRT